MKAVIDTNVLLVANGKHPGLNPDYGCQKECINRLDNIMRNGVVVIDDAQMILTEYRKETEPNQPKGVGDVFLKWVLRNTKNPRRVQRVAITGNAKNSFNEFPADQQLEKAFDPSDRKFAAVANAHPEKPSIWQAVDSKWVNWWSALAKHGITVEFLCPEDICEFYQRANPKKKAALPAQAKRKTGKACGKKKA